MSQNQPTGTSTAKARDFLARIADPSTTALLTMELQNGVVAGDAVFPNLVEQVRQVGLLDTARRLCRSARQAGVPVVHCTKITRSDGAGQAINCKVFALSEKLRAEHGVDPTEIGTRGAALVDGLEDPSDFVVSRLSGMTPFTSTALDQLLRNLGVRTVVATGVSVNLGIFGMALTALDLGYQVVIARDAVTGVPSSYADAVIDNSLSLVATITTSEDLLAVWSAHTSGHPESDPPSV